jgi:hypothetical protein
MCVARDQQSVDLEIGPTTATDVHFPVSDFFGLALLFEAAETIIYRAPGQPWPARPAAPIAKAITFDEIMALSEIDKPDVAKSATTAKFVTRAAYVSTRNFTPTLWTRDSSGTYRDPRTHDGKHRRDASQLLQRAYEAVHFDDARAPHATLRIEVAQPMWCSHLRVGMIWDVYAFDYAASMLA